jgi:hypothetical protein
MATKKQRRRREKLQRHEYEYVVESEEGEEVVVSPSSARPQERQTDKKLPPNAIVDRRGRVIPPPSWTRVLKRGAIFGPLLLLLMFALGGNISTAAKVINAVVMLLIFLPMSYLTDMLIYRSVAKRQGKAAGR